MPYEKMSAQELTHEEAISVIEDIQKYLKRQAITAAYLMNRQASEGDANRNRVNYGAMTQALSTLGHLGHFNEHYTWEDDGLLICEKIIVGDKVIYEKC